MILLVAVILAFIIGLISGGKFAQLAELPVRHAWLALAGFGMQIFMIYAPTGQAGGWFDLHTLILISSYILLLVFVVLNRRLPGLWAIALGLAMNFSVMVANGGYMPITPEAIIAAGKEYQLQEATIGSRIQNTKDILLPREETALWFLSDIFVLPPPFPIPSIFSIGDVFLALGAFILVMRTMHGPAVRR